MRSVPFTAKYLVAFFLYSQKCQVQRLIHMLLSFQENR